MLEPTLWCSLCNSRPSNGTLSIIVDDLPMDVPACEPCVVNIPSEDWIDMTGLETSHDN